MRSALLIAAALLVLPGTAAAQSKTEDIDTLLEAIQLERRIAASNRVMRAAFIRGMRNRSKSRNPALARLIEEEYNAAFPASRIVAEVRPKVVELYDRKFSQEEVRELIGIFRSPLYGKYRDVNGAVGRLIAEATQRSVKSGMGDLMKKVMDRAVSEGLIK
jgi:hypothetical protein